MDVLVRGLIERELDDALEHKTLSNMFILFKNMDPAVKTTRNAVFGFIFGYMLGYFARCMRTLKKRKPSHDEWKEFENWFKRQSIRVNTEISKQLP